MALQKLRLLALKLEDPKHPVLGPTLKGLHFVFVANQTGSKFRTVAYYLVYFGMVSFSLFQSIEFYIVRHDFNKVLNHLSITLLTSVTLIKYLSYIRWKNDWRALQLEISQEELRQLREQDPIVTGQMNVYMKYTRIVTYLYWILGYSTNLLLLTTPLLKYGSSKTYRERIRLGEEPLPQINLCSWFPFDNTKMPGYVWGLCFHVVMGNLGCGVILVYDMNAIAIMSYLKGQMVVLKGKCKKIFVGKMSREAVVERIKECHRHHTVLVKHYKMLNALLSPIMLLYVLFCSVTICCSVIQYNLSGATTSQKLWVIQYSTALVSQLFMYCWHGNEVLFVTEAVDRGIYESEWWKGDKYLRQLVLLLAAKLNAPLKLQAGPFTTLSMPVFLAIMKGSYTFYTLFSQM